MIEVSSIWSHVRVCLLRKLSASTNRSALGEWHGKGNQCGFKRTRIVSNSALRPRRSITPVLFWHDRFICVAFSKSHDIVKIYRSELQLTLLSGTSIARCNVPGAIPNRNHRAHETKYTMIGSRCRPISVLSGHFNLPIIANGIWS